MIFNQRIGGAGGASASILAYGDALQSTDTVYAEKGGQRIIGAYATRPNPDYAGLPAAYQQVEYLESTGEQYINTLVLPSQTARFFAKFRQIDTSDVCTVIGIAVSGRYIPIAVSSHLLFGNGGGISNDNWYKISDSIDLSKDVTADVYFEIGKQVGGTFNDLPIETSMVVGAYTDRPILMFAPDTELGYWTCAVRVMLCKIFSKTGELLRNFIPCYRKSDHKPGLYDTVNDVFYVNQGAGADFLVGAAVPQYKTGFEIAPIREYGTWVLTATHGASTKTINVLVDAAEEFAVEVTA